MQMIVLMGLALVLVFGESNAVLIQADWGVLGLAIGGYWAVTAALTATATWWACAACAAALPPFNWQICALGGCS